MATVLEPALAAPPAALYRLVPDAVEQLTPRWFRLTFTLPDPLSIDPGQFVTIKCESPAGPLLPRPISIHRWDPRSRQLGLLIEERGPATRGFARAAGSLFQLMVPLGHGFTLARGGLHLLIGGGIGAAPLYHLASRLLQAGERPVMLAGFREDGEVCRDLDIAPTGTAVFKAVDRGKLGFQGTVVDMLKALWDELVPSKRPVHAYACGPYGMLRALAEICRANGSDLQVAMEGLMGCGVGACQSCACQTAGGPELLCRCGPVFPSEKVVWHS